MATWCDVWLFDDLVAPTGLLHAPAGIPRERAAQRRRHLRGPPPGHLRPGGSARGHDAQPCRGGDQLPEHLPALRGQGFVERDDKELGLACLQIYNDWMIDDWCGGAGKGRLIPLTLIPLWDPELAADEVRRCAAKGSYAIAFSENPSKLGFPTLYTRRVGRALAACEETETTVSMHIGSSSSMPTTSPDAPLATSMSLYAQNAQGSLADWVFSEYAHALPDLKIAYAESQVGWMPFQLERMDAVWREGGAASMAMASAEPAGQRAGLRLCLRRPVRAEDPRRGRHREDPVRDRLPALRRHLPALAQDRPRAVRAAGMNAEECYKVLRGNAIEAYGLERFGITE